MSSITSIQNNKRKSAVDHNDSSNGQRRPKQNRLEEKNNKIVTDINVEGFAESRAVEIQALTEVVKKNGGNHLAFQKLPRHMRRRAMSHNIKRVPRRLHEAVRSELEKTKPPGKRPSRCFRRRPKNLLAEYERRKRKIGWLETHIWHAKRFKMVQRWNYKLPLHPNEKSIRACYRAVNKHCLMQDVSYESYIEIRGPKQKILQELSHLTSNKTGPTFASQMTLSGTREGKLTLYSYDGYPFDAIGTVTYLWQARHCHDGNEDQDDCSALWICCHPSFYAQALEEVNKCFNKSPNSDISSAQESTSNKCDNEVNVISLRDQLVKFRLYGPASNLVLSEVLQSADIDNKDACGESNKDNKDACGECNKENKEVVSSSMSSSITDAGKDQQDDSSSPKDKDVEVSGRNAGCWWKDFFSSAESRNYFQEQTDCWTQVRKCYSPAEAPSNCLLALTVRDPRLLLPPKKSKVFDISRESTMGVLRPELFTAGLGVSPLWKAEIRKQVKDTKISEQKLNELKSKQAFPGCPMQLGDKESRVPVILIQRPGTSSMSSTSHVGYASGWDVIIPSSWAMAFWVALVYRGARVGGVREARSIALQAGSLCEPFDFPDSPAGREQLQAESEALQARHDRRPPAKRPNYTKLGFQAPFAPQWDHLVKAWSATTKTLLEKLQIEPAVGPRTGGFYVLRDRKCLRFLYSAFIGTTGSGKSSKISRNVKGGGPILKIASSDAWRQVIEHHPFALVPVLLTIHHRGVPAAFGHICLPTLEDMVKFEKDKSFGGPEEKKHIDPEEPIRKEERKIKLKLRRKKKRGKGNKNLNIQSLSAPADIKELSRIAEETQNTKQPETAVNNQNEMNLRNKHVRDVELLGHNSRMVFGFIRNGDFDFGSGHATGLGFCSLAALLHLLEQQGQRKSHLVLFRNPTSFQYRFASLSIMV